MPSFDIVSEVDMHEATNAVDQANREVGNRFDFKGSNASFELKESDIHLEAQSEVQLKQMRDILRSKMSRRDIDIKCLDLGDVTATGTIARQNIGMKQGISKELGKKITKLIKDSKIKVQASIQDEKVRVNGKKRDDLQQVITLLKEKEMDQPLQFLNFRD